MKTNLLTRRAFLSVVAVFPLIRVPNTAASEAYSLTDIGSLAGTGDGRFDILSGLMPSAINDAGDVLCNTRTADGSFWGVPFTNFDGTVHRIGREKAFTYAWDMNNKREIVGYMTNLKDTRFVETQAVIWRDGKMSELPGLGGPATSALAINAGGEVVGSASVSEDPEGPRPAVVWRDSEIIELPSLGGAYCSAIGINDDGLIIGRSRAGDREGYFPCQWESDNIAELEQPEGWRGMPQDVNGEGLIVGAALIDGVTYSAVQWADRKIERLPALMEAGHSFAYEVNDSGDAVGWAHVGSVDSPISVAALWSGGQVVDLNSMLASDSGYVLDTAFSINNHGQILATGHDVTGRLAGLVLTAA